MISSRKIFFYLGFFALIFLFYCLGVMSGIFEESFLGKLLSKNVVTFKTIEPRRYYFLLCLSSSWALMFCIINLKYSPNISKLKTASLGQCVLATILLILIFLMVWPLSTGFLHYPISYNEWPASFTHFLYQEDALFEMLTAILLLLASFQFYIAGKYATKHSPHRLIIVTLFTLSIFSMIILMEEISWGQRFFFWETPKLVIELNSQNETNFHNLINPNILIDSERVFSILLSLALLSAILYKTRIKSPATQGLFPSDKYYSISVIFAFAGMISSELFEEVFAVFLFSYSRDMWIFLKKIPSA